jgi:hypothetical protein
MDQRVFNSNSILNWSLNLNLNSAPIAHGYLDDAYEAYAGGAPGRNNLNHPLHPVMGSP